MAKKEFSYRGKTLKELQELSLKELMLLLPSNQRRKFRRGFTEQEKKFLERIRSGKKNVRTHCRDMIVLPEMVGMTIKVHNGKSFEDLMVQEEMIGHRFGEFAITRKRLTHSAPGIGATKSSSAVSVK